MVEERPRKSGEPVIYLESNARLGGGEGVSDARFRVHRAKIVQNRLIRHFTRESDVARMQDRSPAAHERAAPMGRRAGDVGDAGRGGAFEKFEHRLASARQYQGRARQYGAQVDLQAAVAANVVEGAPNRLRTARRLGRQGAAETLQGMRE